VKLNELFKKGEGEFAIGYKQHLWLLDNEDVEEQTEVYQDMYDTLNAEREDGFPEYADIYDLNGDMADDTYPDIVMGRILNGALYLIGDGNYRHSTASKTLLKIMDELDIEKVIVQGVNFSSDNEYEFEYEQTKEEFLKPLSEKFFYHGTDLNALKKIIKTGIRPQEGKTNYDKIQHSGKVFVTLNPERADFHANTSAANNDSFPVVIKLKIPDVDKLILDYDVAIDVYGYEHELTMSLGYDDIMQYATDGNLTFKTNLTSFVPKDQLDQVRDKSSLNTKLGVFGYLGRIPATMFESIYLNEENLKTQALMDVHGFSMDDIDARSLVGDYNEYTVSEFVEEYRDYVDEIESEMEDEDEDM
jgi:hypothetical protein